MKKSITIFIALVALTTDVKSQWQQTSGPYGGRINCLAAVGSNLFAGTQGAGIFLSTDNANSWSEVNSGLSSSASILVYALAASGTDIFAGTLAGMYVSGDNGSSWALVNNGLPAYLVSAIAVQGTNIFASVYNNGIYFSNDNGNSWLQASNGLPSGNYVSSMVFNGSTIIASLNYVQNNNNVYALYQSTDNGNSWFELTNGTQHIGANCVAVINSNIFAGTSTGILVSSDNGTTWTSANTGLPQYTSIHSIASSGSNIFASCWYGVYKSTDNGASWTAVNNGLSDLHVYTLLVRGTDIFSGTLGGGVFLSSDNGNSWSPVNSGIICNTVYSFASSAGKVFASTHTSGLYSSTDDGSTWISNINNGLPNYSIVNALYVYNSKIFASDGSGLVCVSGDSGISWDTSLIANVNCFGSNGTHIFAAGTWGVYASADNGVTWTPQLTGFPVNPWISCIAVNGSTIYVGSSNYGCYRSANNGNSWTAINNGFPVGTNFNSILIDGNKIFAATSCGSGSGIYESTDNGNSWNLSSPLWVHSFLKLYGAIYAAGWGGVYKSTDNGSSWIAINTGLSNNAIIYSLAVSGPNLLAGTFNYGVWYRPLNEIVGMDEAIADNYSSATIFPNPIATSATITINSPTQIKNSKMFIYEISGKEVCSVVIQTPTTKIERGNLLPGMYFYSIRSGEKQIATGKFTVN